MMKYLTPVHGEKMRITGLANPQLYITAVERRASGAEYSFITAFKTFLMILWNNRYGHVADI